MANERSEGQEQITPADIQQQEFRVTRFGGYRMRDVDEFLDRLTESTTALIAENDRLRSDRGGPILGTSDLDEVNRQADEILRRAREEAARIVAGARDQEGAPVASPEDRAAVDAFLSQERDFLQSLAALVQDHAETVKAMAKQARKRPEPVDASTTEAAPSGPPGGPERGAEGEPEPEPVTASGSSDETQAMPTVDEPDADTIRVDEPEPVPAAGSERERGADGSLRELFWGDES
jgi:DivIVA domain-containing protein